MTELEIYKVLIRVTFLIFIVVATLRLPIQWTAIRALRREGEYRAAAHIAGDMAQAAIIFLLTFLLVMRLQRTDAPVWFNRVTLWSIPVSIGLFVAAWTWTSFQVKRV